MPQLLRTSLPKLPPPKVGKVREIYDLGAELLIVATDRISAFDCVMANGIPGKGQILNLMSAFWFDLFQDVLPNHVISTDDGDVADRIGYRDPELAGRTLIARKARPLTIECVVRGYLAGSLYKDYLGGNDHGFGLPSGIQNSAKLPEPIFTPAIKADEGHDENISFARAADLAGQETAEFVRDKSLEIYKRAAKHAEERGIILADTKFEFGVTDDGIIWIDEALTPDSSRFWDANLYSPGKSQPSFDKQFLRDYLETSGWDKLPPGPTLPEAIVEETRARYQEAFDRLR